MWLPPTKLKRTTTILPFSTTLLNPSCLGSASIKADLDAQSRQGCCRWQWGIAGGEKCLLSLLDRGPPGGDGDGNDGGEGEGESRSVKIFARFLVAAAQDDLSGDVLAGGWGDTVDDAEVFEKGVASSTRFSMLVCSTMRSLLSGVMRPIIVYSQGQSSAPVIVVDSLSGVTACA